jgi:hypothetical protein
MNMIFHKYSSDGTLTGIPYLLYGIFVSCPFSISTVLKTYGQHLKAPAAMVRLRLYETLSLLPSHAFEGKFYVDECRMEVISCVLLEEMVPPAPYRFGCLI